VESSVPNTVVVSVVSHFARTRDIGCGTDVVNSNESKQFTPNREKKKTSFGKRSPHSQDHDLESMIGNENEKTESNQSTIKRGDWIPSQDDVSHQQPQQEVERTSPSPQEITICWKALHSSLLRLIELGYDRSLLFALLPLVEKRIFHSSLLIAYERFVKRIFEWQSDEPSEVVELCQQWNDSYEELSRHFSDHHHHRRHHFHDSLSVQSTQES
jgi:hypothetical protein